MFLSEKFLFCNKNIKFIKYTLNFKKFVCIFSFKKKSEVNTAFIRFFIIKELG